MEKFVLLIWDTNGLFWGPITYHASTLKDKSLIEGVYSYTIYTITPTHFEIWTWDLLSNPTWIWIDPIAPSATKAGWNLNFVA